MRSWCISSALAGQSLAKGRHRRNDTQALLARHTSSSQGVPLRQGNVGARDQKSGSPGLEAVRQRDKGGALIAFATPSFWFYLYVESMKPWRVWCYACQAWAGRQRDTLCADQSNVFLHANSLSYFCIFSCYFSSPISYPPITFQGVHSTGVKMGGSTHEWLLLRESTVQVCVIHGARRLMLSRKLETHPLILQHPQCQPSLWKAQPSSVINTVTPTATQQLWVLKSLYIDQCSSNFSSKFYYQKKVNHVPHPTVGLFEYKNVLDYRTSSVLDMMFLSASILSLEEILVPCCIIAIELSFMMALIPGHRAGLLTWARLTTVPYWHISQARPNSLFFKQVYGYGERFFFFFF